MTEQFFQDYLKHYRPFKDYWNYEDGCVLLGCIRMFQATGAACYAEFVLQYLSERVRPDGTIPGYPVSRYALDSFNSSKALFFAYDLTHDERYAAAAHWQAEQLAAHPRTGSGICWHKQIYPEQVWIDGVYMFAPFLAEYAKRTGDSSCFAEIGRAFRYVTAHMRDPETGLYYHALDESRTQRWADPETGLSRSCWLRGMGWFLMALTDTIALLPESESELSGFLAETLQDAVNALLPFRTENGLLCQIADQPLTAGNYEETSGSLMAAYAMMYGAELQALPEDAFAAGAEMLEAVKREKLVQTDDGISLRGICSAAGLGGSDRRDGSPAYYLSEPVTSDDPKGAGVLMMAEAARIRNQKTAAARRFAAS